MPVNKLDLAKPIDHYKKTFHIIMEITRCSLSVAVDILGKHSLKRVKYNNNNNFIPVFSLLIMVWLI